MKFEEKSFSSRPSSDEYRANWEAAFGKKPQGAQPLCPFEIPARAVHGIRNAIIGATSPQRCTLPKGHAGNHQMEAV
jgi:hypothetical protein